MKYILRFFAPVACLFVFASCSGDDPASPGGGYIAPTYRVTVETMDGGFGAVFGSGANDLYAMGGAIMHYDGSRWTSFAQPPGLHSDLHYGRVFPDKTLLLGGGQGTFLLANGEWNDISDPQAYGDLLWGNAPNNLYKTDCCSVRHFDGSSWTSIDVPGVKDGIYAISGNSSGKVVISSWRGGVARFDGESWSSAVIDSDITYRDVAMTESGRIFGSTYGEVYDITNNTNHLVLRTFITGLHLCVDGDALYVAGHVSYDDNYFVISRLENGEWSNVTVDKGQLTTFWAGNGGVIAAGYDNFLWRDSGNGGKTETLFRPVGSLRCAANIDGKLIVAGDDAFRYEQGTWTSLNKAYVSTKTAYDIVGLRENNIYVVGDQMIMHYDGRQWNWVNGGFDTSLNTAWMDKTGDVWVSGGYFNPAMYHLHGQNWSPVEPPFLKGYVYDIWGSEDALFAVGNHGAAAIRQNGIWRQIPTGTTQTLYSVWGFDDNHVYAVSGDDNTFFSWDGRSWHSAAISNANDAWLTTVWGTTPNDLFVTYRDGLLHYDGHSWQPLPRIFTSGGGDVTGANGEVLLVNSAGTASYRR